MWHCSGVAKMCGRGSVERKIVRLNDNRGPWRKITSRYRTLYIHIHSPLHWRPMPFYGLGFWKKMIGDCYPGNGGRARGMRMKWNEISTRNSLSIERLLVLLYTTTTAVGFMFICALHVSVNDLDFTRFMLRYLLNRTIYAHGLFFVPTLFPYFGKSLPSNSLFGLLYSLRMTIHTWKLCTKTPEIF